MTMPTTELRSWTPNLGLARAAKRRSHLMLHILCLSVASSVSAVAVAGTESATTESTRPVAGADAPAPAASAAEAKQQAMSHFETGLKLYEDGDFSLALIEFERAFSYVPDYRVLYNIGQVSIQLARYARASQALTQYLAQGGRSVPAQRVNSVKEDLKMLEGRTAHLTVTSNVEGAEVLLDDVRIAMTPFDASILVDAGEHRLTVQKPGYVTRSERLVLAGRDDSKLQIDLQEVPKAVSQQVTPMPFRVDQQPRTREKPHQASTARTQWLYIGAGASGLFAIGWAVTGYIGIRAASDLHDALKRPSTQGELESLKSNARAALLASDILGGVALATGATTLYFFLANPNDDPKSDRRRAAALPSERPRSAGVVQELGLHVGPGAVQVTGTF